MLCGRIWLLLLCGDTTSAKRLSTMAFIVWAGEFQVGRRFRRRSKLQSVGMNAKTRLVWMCAILRLIHKGGDVGSGLWTKSSAEINESRFLYAVKRTRHAGPNTAEQYGSLAQYKSL